MRRGLLFTGIAAGAAILFTTSIALVSAKEKRIEAHFDKVREVAYCQKGYEIASSFPSYESRKAPTVEEQKGLSQEADNLEHKSKELDELLLTQLKEEAAQLGVDGQEYENRLQDIKAEVELEAVKVFQQAETPEEVLTKLEDLCADLLKK